MKEFKLTSSLSTNNMTTFDQNGKIVQFKTPEEILEIFFNVRLELYHKRKEYLVSQANKQLSFLSNKVCKCNGLFIFLHDCH